MTSLFDVLAHDDDSQRVAGRKALALAHRRVSERFDDFVAIGRTSGDLTARLELIKDDFDAVVKTACDEVGYDGHEGLTRTLWNERLVHAGDHRTASTEDMTKEARKPKMCPYHSEVVDISLAAGDPTAGFNAMSGHAWSDKHCQGEFEGSCNFKPPMVTQSYWDDKKEKAQERREQREQQAEQQQFEAPQLVEDQAEAPEAEFQVEEVVDDQPDTADSMESDTQEAGLTQDELMAVAASFHQSAPLGPPGSQGIVPDFLRNLPGKAWDAAQSLGQQGNQSLGIPTQMNRGPASPPPAIDPNSVHKQFAQQFGQPGQSGYQQDAHTQENYNQLAESMQTTPEIVRQNLQNFYQNQQQKGKGLSEVSVGGEQLTPAQMASPMAGPAAPGTVQQQPRPRAGLGVRGGSVHEAAEPHGDNLGPIKRQKVDADGEGPVPKMDRAPWTPKAFNQPIDTEVAGSPHPTTRIDIQPDLDEPEVRPENADRRHPRDLDQIGEQVTEHQDVTEAHEVKPPASNNW